MKAILQRVNHASVTVDGHTVGAIGRGLLVLVGISPEDDDVSATWMAKKISELRIFDDDDGKMNLSLSEIGGEVLVISQFTLLADVRRGRRPSFAKAAPPETAKPLYEELCARLRAKGVARVEQGVFGANMAVALVNDGPVTLTLEHP